MIHVVHSVSGSRIRILNLYPSRIPDPGGVTLILKCTTGINSGFTLTLPSAWLVAVWDWNLEISSQPDWRIGWTLPSTWLIAGWDWNLEISTFTWLYDWEDDRCPPSGWSLAWAIIRRSAHLPDCMVEKMIAAVHLADRWQGLFSVDQLFYLTVWLRRWSLAGTVFCRSALLPDCMIEKMIAAVHLADRWHGLFSVDQIIYLTVWLRRWSLPSTWRTGSSDGHSEMNLLVSITSFWSFLQHTVSFTSCIAHARTVN